MILHHAIIADRDGGLLNAVSRRFADLNEFCYRYTVRMGGKVLTVATRRDLCGPSCGRIRFEPCPVCDPVSVRMKDAGVPIPVPR